MKGFPVNIQRQVFEAQNGMCAVLNCYNTIQDFHHRLPQNKTNRKLYPLFIDSPFNCVGLCRDCHTNRSHLFRINDKLAQVYEDYLRNFADEWYRKGRTDGYQEAEKIGRR